MYHKKYAIKNWHVQYNAMEYTLILSRSFPTPLPSPLPSFPHSPPFPNLSSDTRVGVNSGIEKRSR